MDILSQEERKEVEDTMRETLKHLLSGNLTIDQVVKAFGDSVNNSTEIVLEQQQEIERLKGEVDSLRCCGNCKDFNDSSDGYICDIGYLEDCTNIDCCDLWQPLPKAPEVG